MTRQFATIFFLVTFLLISTTSSFAINSGLSNFDKLNQINCQWQFHSTDLPKSVVNTESDKELIQIHLKLVCKALLKNTPADLSFNQLSNRIELIGKLNQYANEKNFPTNHYHSSRRPYFVDNFGVHCAVGHLMAVSGYEHLVAQIKANHNFDYIADIKTQGVSEWAEYHGFTIEELKWIQPTYQPSTTISPMGAGTNGVVNELKYDYYGGQRIIISGEFTTLNDLPCLNIGYFKDGQLSCLGGGVAGVVNCVIPNSNGLYVFGSLTDGVLNYPAAFYDGTTWNFLSIPGCDNAVCTAVTLGGGSYIAQAAISHSAIPNMQEIWFLTYALTWEKKALVNGVVMDANISNMGRIFVGHFDTLTAFNTSGAVVGLYPVSNIAIYEDWGVGWSGLNGEVSDTIKAVKAVGDNIYFGGTCSSNPGNSDVCLTRYLNGVFQPLFIKQTYMGPDDFSVNTIEFKSGNILIVGGDFLMDAGMMGTYGNNLAIYNIIYNSFDPQAIFDAPVNSVAYLGNTLYIGGEFSTNKIFNQLNHLGRIISYVETEEIETADEITVFPNPFVNYLNVNGVKNGAPFVLFNMAGQMVFSGVIASQKINGLERLETGLYLLYIETDYGNKILKVKK